MLFKVLLDAPSLQQLRIKHGIKCMYFTPAHLAALVEYQPDTLDDLDLVFVWGEKLSSKLCLAMADKQPQVSTI